jgi:general stress protein 26
MRAGALLGGPSESNAAPIVGRRIRCAAGAFAWFNQEIDMSDKTLAALAEKMRDIDFAMLATHTDGGAIGQRPMSNNREVDYDGDSYYFTWADSRMVRDIKRDPQVSLSFLGKSGLFGQRPFFVAVEGTAEIVRDKAAFADHWTRDLDRWFEQGIDTPGVAMIHVHAARIHYWDGEDEGELQVAGSVAA